MRIIFPRYTSSFLCCCPINEISCKLHQMAQDRKNSFKIKKVESLESGVKIVLRTSTGSMLYHNSFLPKITIELRDDRGKTNVTMLFELTPDVKAFQIVFYVVGLIFLLALLTSWICGQLTTGLILLIPLSILLFGYFLSTIGLWSSSKNLLKLISATITNEEFRNIPLQRK